MVFGKCIVPISLSLARSFLVGRTTTTGLLGPADCSDADAGQGGNPGQESGDAGESGRIADLAAGRRAEGDDADLGEAAVALHLAQRATAVALERARKKT